LRHLGFLSNALSGEAETILKQAGVLKGVEAWRRVVRYIDHGRGIRLEIMRNKMRHLRSKAIKTLEGVTIGIAEFENTISDFVSAGGVRPSDAEMKSDLNAILPASLSEQLAMRVADVNYTYQGFRDFVVNQTQIILMNRNRLPLHAVEDDNLQDTTGGGGDDDDDNCNDEGQELISQILAFVKGRSNGGRFQKRTTGAPRNAARTPTGGGARDPKCPNCHGNHTKAECKKPPVDMADRTCFTCGEKNHSSRNCPKGNARPGKPLKSVVMKDGPLANLRIPTFAVNDSDEQLDHSGFTRVPRGKAAKAFPRPRQATLGDFITNRFKAISVVDDPDDQVSYDG